MFQQSGSPFHSKKYLIISDILIVLTSILFIIADFAHTNQKVDQDTTSKGQSPQNLPSLSAWIYVLSILKPFPIIIMMWQLFPVKLLNESVSCIFWGLLFGIGGDICLLISSFLSSQPLEGVNLVFFAIGAASFLVGHILYVIGYMIAAVDINGTTFRLGDTLKSKCLYIIIWIIVISLSFWLVSGMVKSLDQKSIFIFILPVYGSILLLDAVAALYLLFMTYRFECKIGVFIVIGAFLFYASDALIAQGKFNKNYPLYPKDKENINGILIMATYYISQFFITKGALWIAKYFRDNKPHGTELEYHI